MKSCTFLYQYQFVCTEIWAFYIFIQNNLSYTEQAQTIISSNLGRKFSHNLRDRLKINVLLNNIRVFNDCIVVYFYQTLSWTWM